MTEEQISWKIRVKVGEREVEVVGKSLEEIKNVFKENEHYLVPTPPSRGPMPGL
jgi:hypothetical protein